MTVLDAETVGQLVTGGRGALAKEILRRGGTDPDWAADLAAPKHQTSRRSFVDSVLGSIPVLAYDTDVATEHAGLLVAARQAGRQRGAHDLIIAATAKASKRTVISSDSSAFTDLPGVMVRDHR